MKRGSLRTTLIVLACVGLGVGLYGSSAGQEDHRQDVMRAKLNHAHGVIDALVAEDYDALGKHSQQLSLLSLESSWRMLETQEYARHSADFRRAVDLLTQAARDTNLDGATLAYFQMTLSCVNCHKHLRHVKR